MIRQGTDVLKEHSKKNNITFKPKLERIDFLDRRVYQRDKDLYYPSVTTVLQYMPKAKYFEEWLKDVGHNANIIVDRAGKEGTQVHTAVEELLETGKIEWLDEYGRAKYNLTVWKMIMRFYSFWTTYKPKLVHSEIFTYSDEFKYAGTADLIIKLKGKLWLLDVKTSNTLSKVYDLQLAAYAKALEETENIKVEKTGILWLKAQTRKASKASGVYQGEGWKIKEVGEIEKNFDLFQTIYKLYSLENPKIEPLYNSYPTVLSL